MKVPDYKNRAIKAVWKELGWRVNLGDVKDFSRGDDHKVFEVVHEEFKAVVRMARLKKVRSLFITEWKGISCLHVCGHANNGRNYIFLRFQ